ncbi:MAG: glycosyltransferase family 2 protein [Polyangiales bacterium]
MMTTAAPTVSIVAMCYNHGKFLRDCLDSIFAQEGDHTFEIILVDDASTDDSEAVARSYSDPRLTYVRHAKNTGHVTTAHDGFALARGRYVARVDSDDRYRPSFLRETIAIFERYPEVGLVYGNPAIMNTAGYVVAEWEQYTSDLHDNRDYRGNIYVRLLERNFICAPTAIARREAWEQSLPIPAHLAFSDWYTSLQIARRYDAYYLDKTLADYRVHAQNSHTHISRNKSEEESVFWLLDKLYSEQEPRAELEEPKRRARDRVYGANYLILAEKYFGFGMNEDARRCYFEAVRRQPSDLAKAGVARRFAATMLPRPLYDASKAALRGLRRGRSS